MNVYVLYIFYLANTVLSYLLSAYKVSLLNAYQRQDVVSNTLTITQGGMYICQIIVLILIRNYYAYAALMVVFTILNNIINAIKVKHLFPKYKCSGKIKERELASIKRQVPGLLVTKLCYISRNSFDSIFISAFLGLKISAMYGNYYYIMNAVVSILKIISNSILAGVGNSQVTDTAENNYNTMNKINFIYMWISGWCTICLLCLYQPFMKVWVGTELSLDFGVVILLCVYFYITEMGEIRGVYSDAAGLWWENRYRALIESVANLVLNYVLVQWLGIYGIILATVLSLFFINFCWGSQIVFQQYFKNGKQKDYFWYHLRYASVTLLVAAVTYILCALLPFEGVMAVIFRGLVCCIVPNVMYVLIYYRTDMYRMAIPWILERTKLTRRLGFLLPKNQRSI
jgi:O-antigen/teichoic acid export membrane protein